MWVDERWEGTEPLSGSGCDAMGYERPAVEPRKSSTRALTEVDLGTAGSRLLAALRAVDPACPFPRARLTPDILPPECLPHLCLFEALPDGDFRCRLFGTGLTKAYGLDMTGRMLADFWTGEPAAVTAETYKRALTLDRPTLTVTACRLDEETMRYERVLVPLCDGEGVPRYVLALVDVQDIPRHYTVLERLTPSRDRLGLGG